MRWLAVVAIAACSSPTRTDTPRPKRQKPDATTEPAAKPTGKRGAACEARDDVTGTCTPGLVCAPSPGGYCTSSCGPTGSACEGGVCVDTTRDGNVCLATCTRDAECRAAEGYVCDRSWNACVHPAAIPIAPRPPACPQIAAPPRGAFGPSERLSSSASPGLYDVAPATAITPTGDLVALYVGGARIGERNRLAVARITADGARSFDVPFVDDDRDNHAAPWLAVDATGAVHAVWAASDRDGAKNAMIGHAVSRDAGKTWSKPVPVHDAVADCAGGAAGCVVAPMIAIGKGGAIHVAYVETSTRSLRLVTSRDGGTTWTRAVTAHPGENGDLAVDAAGTVHVAAIAGDPTKNVLGGIDKQITYASSTDGGKTFGAPSLVSAEGEPIPYFFARPTLALDRGIVHVLYPTGTPDGAWDVVLASSSDRGKAWTRVKVNDDARCASHMAPQVVVDPSTGAVHVAWLENRGTAGRLAYAVCDRGGGRCGANQSISDRPFASYGFVRHGGTWVGDSFGFALDPRRRLLHAVWAQPVGEGLYPVSRIFHAQAKLAAATRERRGRGSP
jgi:hypothetical protein